MFFVRESFHEGFVCGVNIFRLSLKSNPPEGALSFTKKRSNIGWYKSWKIKGMGQATQFCLGTNIISIVKDMCSSLLEIEHGLNMNDDRINGALNISRRIFLSK